MREMLHGMPEMSWNMTEIRYGMHPLTQVMSPSEQVMSPLEQMHRVPDQQIHAPGLKMTFLLRNIHPGEPNIPVPERNRHGGDASRMVERFTLNSMKSGGQNAG